MRGGPDDFENCAFISYESQSCRVKSRVSSGRGGEVCVVQNSENRKLMSSGH